MINSLVPTGMKTSLGLRVSPTRVFSRNMYFALDRKLFLCMHVVRVCFQLSVACLTIYRIKPVVVVVFAVVVVVVLAVAFIIHRVEIFLKSVISTFLLPAIKTISVQKFFLAF